VKALCVVLFSAAAVAGCQQEFCEVDADILEAAVEKLENQNAKYGAALDWLKKVHERPSGCGGIRPEPNADAVYAVDIEQNVERGYAQGPPHGARVTIVAAEDFACPYCERLSGVLDELQDEYGDRLRVVFKNMVVHPQVMNAHLAGCAAATQGKFQEWKTMWWQKGFKPRKMDDATVVTIAKEIGLDLDKFEADRNGGQCAAFVQRDMAELQKFSVISTPTLFVNGTYVAGLRSKEVVKQMIDDKLEVATAADYYDKVVMATGDGQFPPESED
jgi:protein-disulfide isomerase